MVANGQRQAQLVGGEWQWCVLSLSTPPWQKVLVQAVTQLTLQSLFRDMPKMLCRLHLRGTGIGV